MESLLRQTSVRKKHISRGEEFIYIMDNTKAKERRRTRTTRRVRRTRTMPNSTRARRRRRRRWRWRMRGRLFAPAQRIIMYVNYCQ